MDRPLYLLVSWSGDSDRLLSLGLAVSSVLNDPIGGQQWEGNVTQSAQAHSSPAPPTVHAREGSQTTTLKRPESGVYPSVAGHLHWPFL